MKFYFHFFSSSESTLTDSDTRLIVLPKAGLDKANEDTKHYPPNFVVCADFSVILLQSVLSRWL